MAVAAHFPAKKHFHPAASRVTFKTRDDSSPRGLIGQIPKWPTGEDCKSSGFAFTGSNPVLPILFAKPVKYFILLFFWFGHIMPVSAP